MSFIGNRTFNNFDVKKVLFSEFVYSGTGRSDPVISTDLAHNMKHVAIYAAELICPEVEINKTLTTYNSSLSYYLYESAKVGQE